MRRSNARGPGMAGRPAIHSPGAVLRATGCGTCVAACAACPALASARSRVQGDSQQGRPPTENGVVAIQMRGRVHHDRKVGCVSVGSHVGLRQQQHGAVLRRQHGAVFKPQVATAARCVASNSISQSRAGWRPGEPMLACAGSPTRLASRREGKHAPRVRCMRLRPIGCCCCCCRLCCYAGQMSAVLEV